MLERWLFYGLIIIKRLWCLVQQLLVWKAVLRAGKGVYQHLRLTQRANPLARIPEVQVIDFRDYIGQNETSNFTPPLLEAIQDRLAKKRAGGSHAQSPWLF